MGSVWPLNVQADLALANDDLEAHVVHGPPPLQIILVSAAYYRGQIAAEKLAEHFDMTPHQIKVITGAHVDVLRGREIDNDTVQVHIESWPRRPDDALNLRHELRRCGWNGVE